MKLGNKTLGKFFIILDPLPPLKSREFFAGLVWEIKSQILSFVDDFAEIMQYFPYRLKNINPCLPPLIIREFFACLVWEMKPQTSSFVDDFAEIMQYFPYRLENMDICF